MGLKGNLSTVNLADVFQVLSRGNSTGLLRIQAPEGPRFVEIQNGVISIAGRSAERIMLGDLLLSRGLLEEQKLEHALQVQKDTGKMLGQVLLDLGVITMEQLEEALRFQIEEEVCELFILRSGDFDFLANATLDAKIAPGGGLVRLKLDPNALLIEAARRADEWNAVEQRIPSQCFLLQLTSVGQQVLHSGEGISAEGGILLKLVLAQRTIESMVQKACLGRLTTNQMLLELWDAGMVEPMPLANYEKVAREHLRLKRYEEAQRIASYAAEYGEPDQKERAQLALADIDKARKIVAQASSVKVTTDPKVRSEVIRRSQPNLILRKERAAWPLVVGAILIILAAGAAAVYFLVLNTGKEDKTYRRDFDEMKGKAQTLINEDNWTEARKIIDDYITHDPTIKRELKEFFENKFQKPFELRLLQAIARFTVAYSENKPKELKVAAADFEKLLPIPVQDVEIKGVRDTAIPKLERYLNEQKAATFKDRLAKIKATIKDSQALEEAYNRLLKEEPPEASAAPLREELSRLAKARIDASRILKQAQELQKKGDLETARLELERIKQLGIGGQLSKAVETALKQIADANTKAQTDLSKIEALKKTEQEAALVKFLDSKPPHQYAGRALSLLHMLRADDPETDLVTALREAERLPPAEGRPKILALVQKNPYAKASWKATIKVNVTSEPPGADVFLISFNEELKGKTPMTLNLPVLARFSLTFKLAAFQDYEFSDSGFRGEKIQVTLNRKEMVARRLPVAACNGIGLTDENVIAVGEGELVLCSRPEVKVVQRLKLPPPGAGSGPKTAVTVNEAQALISADKWLLRIRIPGGETERANLGEVATSAPLLAQEKKVLLVATKAGCESFHADLKLNKKTALGDKPGEPPYGMVSDGEVFFIPRETELAAVVGASCDKKWSADVGAKLAGGPGWNPSAGAVAVVDVNGCVSVFDPENGTKRFQRDLKTPSVSGCLGIGQGFLVLLKGGKAELCSAKEDKSLWSAALAGDAVLPALAVTDKAAVVCTSQGEEHYLYVLSADNGSVLWRAQLYAKAVGLATDGKRILVSTEDCELAVFDLQ